MKTPTPLYRELACKLRAIESCAESGNTEWEVKHSEEVEKLVKEFMPRGSGISGTMIDWDESTSEKLVFTFSYHHMNECGMYDGWTDHKLTVTPSLWLGTNLELKGENRDDIHHYLFKECDYCLNQKVWQDDNWEWHSECYETLPEKR